MKKVLYSCIFLVILMISFMPINPIISYAITYIDLFNIKECPLDNTTIEDDLLGLIINDKEFSFDDYKADNTKNLQMLYFAEFGYEGKFLYSTVEGILENEDFKNHYSLYIYIYNPQLLDFNNQSIQNNIQLSFYGYYEKYNLIFIDSYQDDLFLKFRVDYDRYVREPSFSRCYNISSIELLEKSNNNATDYRIAFSYVYSGFSKGYNGQIVSTMNVDVTNLEVIEINVKDTFYRTDTSSKGKDYKNNLSSVYFSIPIDLLNSYGDLYAIECEFYEYKTKPMIITNHSEICDWIIETRGINVIGNTSLELGYNKQLEGNCIVYDWSYNIADKVQNGDNWIVKSKDRDDILYYAFLSDDDYIDSDEIKNYIYNYDGSGDKIENGKAYSVLFEDTVDSGRTKGYNRIEIPADANFDMLSYDETHSWFDKFQDYGLWFWKYDTDDNFKNVVPIKRVDSLPSDISNELLINENDISEFTNYYNDACNNDEQVYLFRFAQTDYFAGNLEIKFNDNNYGGGPTNSYMAKQTMFFDFDIITFTFEKSNDYTVLPVVSNPIDIIGDNTEPELPPVKDIFDFDKLKEFDWKKLLMIIALVIILIILLPMLPYIIKLVIWIITLPFKIVKYLIDAIKRVRYKK